jgi:FkbM family methyltransferase
MMFDIKQFSPRVIDLGLRYLTKVWNSSKPFPHLITLTSMVAKGCKFEVTTPIEEGRVVSLGGEAEFMRKFLGEIREGDVVFDIGSCVGLYALHLSLLGRRVVAFEPDPNYRSRLLRNISLNNLQDQIQVVEWAVSDRKGEAMLYTDGVEGLSPSLRLVGERGAVVISTDSIDNALARGELPHPTVIKMDIEGAEILALRGMRQLLSSTNPPDRLFIELHPQFLPHFGSSVDECLSIIKFYGYVQEYFVLRADQLHCIFKYKNRQGLSN